MFRSLFRFLVLILVVAVVRYLVRLFSQAFSKPAAAGPNRQPAIQTHGELKRDPVCGTFVAVSSSVKKSVGGETIHFCSAACRDKYLVG
ncbi:MAG: hypothetical protein HYR60_17340 [Acidobacteria bacterium]|nr:hypothetical protein [Acidobacteriota bacterium]MBI3473044.1 hypothetical protein [Candidatus Solibacter usitatus]